jgi:hypothetical protein
MSASARRALCVAALQTERASVAARGKAVASEAAPIQYVAAVFGVTDPETAIRWLILMMVLCCDPLAIALTAAAAGQGSARRERGGAGQR